MDNLFVVDLTYVAPLQRVERLLPPHMEFLDRGYAQGLFVASGPKSPRTGGVILARAPSREALEAFVRTDPFLTNEVAAVNITEFSAKKSVKAIETLLSSPT